MIFFGVKEFVGIFFYLDLDIDFNNFVDYFWNGFVINGVVCVSGIVKMFVI